MLTKKYSKPLLGKTSKQDLNEEQEESYVIDQLSETVKVEEEEDDRFTVPDGTPFSFEVGIS